MGDIFGGCWTSICKHQILWISKNANRKCYQTPVQIIKVPDIVYIKYFKFKLLNILWVKFGKQNSLKCQMLSFEHPSPPLESYTFQSYNFSLHSSTWLCEMILFLKDPIFRWLKRLEGPNLNWFIALLDQTTRKEHLRNWTTAKCIWCLIFEWFHLKYILWVGWKKIRWFVKKKYFTSINARYI